MIQDTCRMLLIEEVTRCKLRRPREQATRKQGTSSKNRESKMENQRPKVQVVKCNLKDTTYQVPSVQVTMPKEQRANNKVPSRKRKPRISFDYLDSTNFKVHCTLCELQSTSCNVHAANCKVHTELCTLQIDDTHWKNHEELSTKSQTHGTHLRYSAPW